MSLINKNFISISPRILKHKDQNIYALKIPIPPNDEFTPYHQDKQEFRFFELEHLFPLEILQSYNMVQDTSIPGIYEIKSNKKSFAKELLQINDPLVFQNFIYLFREIDQITQVELNYIE